MKRIWKKKYIGNAVISNDGRWLQVDQALCRITGYSQEELLGMTLEDIVFPNDFKCLHERLVRLWYGEVDAFRQESRYIHNSGRVAWVDSNIFWVKAQADNSPGYYIFRIQDISRWKKEEEERSLAWQPAYLQTPRTAFLFWPVIRNGIMFRSGHYDTFFL